MARVRHSGQTVVTAVNDILLTNVQQTVLIDASLNSVVVTFPAATDGEYKYLIEIIDDTEEIVFDTT